MVRSSIVLLVPVVLLLGGALVAGGLRAGEERPAFLPILRLPTLEGKPLATSDFRGKPMLLVEFASW